MITTKNFTSQTDNIITVKYPTGAIFMRERNYLTVSCEVDDYYLKKIVLAGKTINFGRYYLMGKPMTLDVTPYYAKLYKSGTISLVIENILGDDETFTVPISITKIEGYSPFLEFVPERCGDAQNARIVPPYRMLWDGKKKSTSMLAAVRDDDYFSGYEYEMEGVPHASYRPSNAWTTTILKQIHLGETYRNTLPVAADIAVYALWIEQGGYRGIIGQSYEEERVYSSIRCRTKTIFNNYNGLTIGACPEGIKASVFFYDANKKYASRAGYTAEEQTFYNADTYPYIAILFAKTNDMLDIEPSDLMGIRSSRLTNPEAGKSYRWVYKDGVYSWLELTAEQIINISFAWSFGDTMYFDDVINKTATFSGSFEAFYQKMRALSPEVNKYINIQKVERSVSIADSSIPYVYIRWRTPWGVTIEHLFYLGTYSSDKADTKELESVNYYEELSKHVRVGSFYLDGITQPYDLFYYKTLENSELVEMYFTSYAFKPNTYMPTGDDYVAIKIKNSDVAEAVVDGIAQRVITFKFELS